MLFSSHPKKLGGPSLKSNWLPIQSITMSFHSSANSIVDVIYGLFDDDEVLKARLKQNIKNREVHKFISDLVSEKPLIVVAIDQRTEKLDEALRHIGDEVQIVEFRTFRREGLSDDINAYMFEPVATKGKKISRRQWSRPLCQNDHTNDGELCSQYLNFLMIRVLITSLIISANLLPEK